MRTSTIKFLAAGAIIVSAITYLAFAGMKDGWVQYHLTVDEFAGKPEFKAQRVRLAGQVAESGLVIGSGRLGARFNLQGQTTTLPVSYGGVLPDLFKAGCDVVIEGRADSVGVFRADLLMTKCASKYDPEHGHKTEKPS